MAYKNYAGVGRAKMVSNIEIILRLLLSAIVGGLIGIEREANNRPAGFRTHILVTLGATLIMLLSSQGFTGLGGRNDPARLAAQVVSGIGFLGAGTIVRNGNNIKGLTTAASLWVCGGVGLAIGGGYYLGGVITAIIAFISLRYLGALEKKILNKQYKMVILYCCERPGLIGDLGQVFGNNDIMIKAIQIERNDVDSGDALVCNINGLSYGAVELALTIMLNDGLNYQKFNGLISQVPGVEKILWVN